MGGSNSGQSGGRPTVDSSLTLEVYTVLKDRNRDARSPVKGWRGTITWTNTRTGKATDNIGYEAVLWPDHGKVKLFYTTTHYSGEKHVSDYSVDLVTTPQPFGGLRWWFVCPISGDHVAKLHLPGGQACSDRVVRIGWDIDLSAKASGT